MQIQQRRNGEFELKVEETRKLEDWLRDGMQDLRHGLEHKGKKRIQMF